MKKNIHLIIGLLIAAFTIHYTFKNISIKEILETISHIKYFYFIHVFLLLTLSFVLRTYRWTFLISSIKKVKVSRIYSPMMIGFMGNLLPARAGEFIRAYLMGKRENIDFSASFSTIFVERLFDILAILTIASIFMFTKGEKFSQIIVLNNMSLLEVSKKFGVISITLCLSIILFSILILYRKNYFISIVQFLTKPFPESMSKKIYSIIDSFSEGLQILKHFKDFFIVLIYTSVIWFSVVLTNYSLYKVFDINNIPFASAPLLTVMICIFIAVLPTPGYVGSYQAGCIVALHKIFSVSEPIAASYGIISWFINMGFVTISGIFFIIKDNISLKDIKKE